MAAKYGPKSSEDGSVGCDHHARCWSIPLRIYCHNSSHSQDLLRYFRCNIFFNINFSFFMNTVLTLSSLPLSFFHFFNFLSVYLQTIYLYFYDHPVLFFSLYLISFYRSKLIFYNSSPCLHFKCQVPKKCG